MSVAFALVPAFWCASRVVIQAFVFVLLCVAPHPVLGVRIRVPGKGSQGVLEVP